MQYPVFRKLVNKAVFYKISDDITFTEYSRIGGGLHTFVFKAKNYFDFQLISNLIESNYPYQESTEGELDQFLAKKKEP